MNRPEGVETLAIVVALTDPPPILEASLARFAEEAGPLGEVWLVDASGVPSSDGHSLVPTLRVGMPSSTLPRRLQASPRRPQEDAERPGRHSHAERGNETVPGNREVVPSLFLSPRFANVRVIRRPVGSLAPELWREGLLATDADLVALTTAQMIPRNGWLASLKDKLIETGAAGVGGPIEPGSHLSSTDRAVALLRYSGYFPALPDPTRVEPPGDNALYRRDRLMDVPSSWSDGFWEVDVHQALRNRGESLAMAGSAVVRFGGGIRLGSMIRQRWLHARRFGAGRARGLSRFAQMTRIAAGPLVPFVLCGRIVKALKTRKMALKPWLSALPSLMVLASAWAIGEAVGTWRGPKSSIETAPPATDPISMDRTDVPVTQLA